MGSSWSQITSKNIKRHQKAQIGTKKEREIRIQCIPLDQKPLQEFRWLHLSQRSV